MIDNKDKKVDETVRVEISQDKMLGVISFKEAENGGQKITLDKLKQGIQEAGIVSGINEELITSLIDEKLYNHKYLIARGRPPVHGTDGVLELFFKSESSDVKSLRPKENDDGSVDFKKLDLIQTIQKDQKLAQVTLPTKGEPGENVLGKSIKPAKGKVVRLPKGKNVYTSSDYLTLYASLEGQLIYEHGQVIISETYVVDGDAGVATGDIDFSGNVFVKGNLESGYTINAGGNVEIQGFVEEATIIAGHDILLRHGIQGKNNGKLIAGGDIFAKFIQNSSVEANGSLYTEAIMHSQVQVGDSVVVEVNKGLIAGGTVQATNLISAKIIGSPMSTATTVKISMALSLQRQYNTVQTELGKKKQQLDQVEKNIAFIHNKMAKGEEIPRARLDLLKPMITLQQQLAVETQSLQKEYESLSGKLKDYRSGMVKVRDIMYPGCKVVMGSYVRHIRDDIKYARIIVEDKDIKIDAYN